MIPGNIVGKSENPQRLQRSSSCLKPHAQQEPSFASSIAFTRLTAVEALRQLKVQGYDDEQLPAASTMAVVLNRLGDRLRKVVKVKPKKSP